jgi:hypothetical protein
MKRAILTAAFLLVSTAAYAQTPVLGTEQLTWNQGAASLAIAQAYEYKVYVDGAATGAVLVPVTCAGGASPFVCSTPFPPSTPGNHQFEVSATFVSGAVRAESLKSAPLPFVLIVAPTAPTNLRITGD